MKNKTNVKLAIVMFGTAIAMNVAVARPWVPTDLTNAALVVWIDADDASTLWADTNATIQATTAVARWNDKSGNNNHAIQSVASEQPTINTNEVLFDGNDILDVTNDPFKDLQNFAVLLVGRWTAVPSGSYRNYMVSWTAQTTGGGWGLGNAYTDNLSFRRHGDRNDVAMISGPRPQPLTVDFVGGGYKFDGTHSQKRVNGTVTLTVSNDNGVLIPYDGVNRSAIGGVYTGDNWGTIDTGKYYTGVIKEMVVVSVATLDEVQSLEGYLAWKWGLEGNLPTEHPYKDGPPPEIPPAGTVVVIK